MTVLRISVRISSQWPCNVSHISRVMIRVIIRWNRRLCTDLLAFTSQLSKIQENFSYETIYEDCATSHRLKWDPFPPNEVSKIAQHVRKGEGKFNWTFWCTSKICLKINYLISLIICEWRVFRYFKLLAFSPNYIFTCNCDWGTGHVKHRATLNCLRISWCEVSSQLVSPENP